MQTPTYQSAFNECSSLMPSPFILSKNTVYPEVEHAFSQILNELYKKDSRINELEKEIANLKQQIMLLSKSNNNHNSNSYGKCNNVNTFDDIPLRNELMSTFKATNSRGASNKGVTSMHNNNNNINDNSHNTNKSISKICNKVSMNIVNVNYRKRNLSNSNKNQKRNKSITFSNNTNTTKPANTTTTNNTNTNNIETNCSNVVVTTTTNTTLANNSITHNNNNNITSNKAGCTRTRALSGGGGGNSINKSRNKRLVIRSDVINNNATVNVISNHKLNKQKMMSELFQTNQNVLCKRGLPLSKFSPNRKGNNNGSSSGNKMKVVNITVTEPNHSSNLKTKNKMKGIIRPKSKGKLSIDMSNNSLTNNNYNNEKVHHTHTNIMKRK